MDGELNRVRAALGFPTSEELRLRVARVLTDLQYDVPETVSRRRVLVDQPAQTETVERRDMGVVNGWTETDQSVERSVAIDARYPVPRVADFPILTHAQLAEAESRVRVLLRRIEQELDTVAQEENTARRKRTSLEPYGAAPLLSTDAWNARMQRLIATRLEMKYQQPTRKRDGAAALELLQQRQAAASLPLQTAARSPHRASGVPAQSHLSPSVRRAAAAPLFNDALAFMDRLDAQRKPLQDAQRAAATAVRELPPVSTLRSSLWSSAHHSADPLAASLSTPPLAASFFSLADLPVTNGA